mgnify:CR=1 FL=1|jgi:hypothetical protein
MQSSFSKESNNFTSYPIPITKSNNNLSYYNNIDSILNNSDEYELKSNIFNPSKLSPPNLWKYRLENRIKILSANENIIKICNNINNL